MIINLFKDMIIESKIISVILFGLGTFFPFMWVNGII